MSTPRTSAESFASLFEQSPEATRPRRQYHVGERVEVTIVAVAREAVFADLGGKQEGVFERIELVDDEGKLRVEVGSKVAAVVGNIDKGTGQVKLSPVVIRGAEADVGVARATATGVGGSAGPVLVEGARIKGKVTGVERYGVFVQVSGTSGRSGRGLVPTQETGTPRGADLKKHFAVGTEVEAKILSIDETGKIRLSIAALGADDERGMFDAYKAGQGDAPATGEGAPKAAAKGKEKKPEPRGFGTLADLLPKVAPKAPVEKAPAKAASAARKMADSASKGGSRKR